MKIQKKRKVISLLLGISTLPIAFGLISAKCQKSASMSIKTSSYADLMQKLANKTITVAGSWADARYHAGQDQDKLVAVGATTLISNDGIQARKDLKKGDIEAIQELLIEAIKKSYEQKDEKLKKKENSEGDLTLIDKKDNKLKSVFQVYNHDGYSKVSFDANISFNTKGDTKKAYKNTPAEGNEYFKYDITKKTFSVIDAKRILKIQFIPSSDAALVTKATEKLEKYIKSKGISNIQISVSSDYNSAASALKAGSIDIAFLPIDAWARLGGDSSFILQAGRNVQIIDPYQSVSNPSTPKFNDEKLLVDAHNNYKNFNKDSRVGSLHIDKEKTKNIQENIEGYSKELKNHIDTLISENELPKVGYYRSYIYVNKETEIYKIIKKALDEQGSDWKLNWDEVSKHIVYGYTSTTSAATFVYPEEWFKKHFIGFKSFLK
ncbi:PhnD/SsuA/transferrin family substrate-binding protein [Metamycoplasma alkalescens]|uniref:Uncharacterized protein n=1 Tax=Metamycoplasma alkalescens 14918 TaxID=1188234 RepID=N9UAP0_9BACT|nr:PhnD/SsuA/transferrin family substrate-binding protein [Metamycoplasma alkalescens]ENY53746.1 Hypothetical protein, predicted lipoprotein [Metamycoplasma alkalescens 14918]